MENLFLPEIDYTEPPEFNMRTYSHWSLKNDSLEEYRYLESIFSPEEIRNIIKVGWSYVKAESKTGDGEGFSAIRKSKNSWIPPSEISNWIYERIQAAVVEVNKHFEFDLHSLENLQFTEYNSEYKGHYHRHIDKFPTAVSPNSHRKLSFSIQLSDPNSYSGGDLIIYNGTQMVANKNMGTINFFPSYTLHEVTPVTEGTRYSLVGWCSGPRFR